MTPHVWNVSNALQAGAKTECAYNGALVPCEIVPTVLLDIVERRNAVLQTLYDNEVMRHNETLGLLAEAHDRAVAAEQAASLYKAERDATLSALRSKTPTWLWWTLVGTAAAIGTGLSLWIAL